MPKLAQFHQYSNYATTGIIGRKADGYTLNEQHVPNYFYFDSFTANHNAKTKRGDLDSNIL